MSETMGRLLAAGQRAEVFEWGSRVVKLYRSTVSKQVAFHEAGIHATVEAMGLPVPTVWSVQQIADRWGIVFDRVNGVSFAEQMQGDAAPIPQHLEILARLHTRIHAHPAKQFRSLKVWLAASITRTTLLDEPRKRILLNGLRDMPDGDRLCHGDFHPMNVLGDASQPIVIDWPNACGDELRRVYYPEADRLVAEATGATRMLVFDHTIRRRVAGGIDRPPGTPRQPVTSVHNDYTVKIRPAAGPRLDGLGSRRAASSSLRDRQRVAADPRAVARCAARRLRCDERRFRGFRPL
jgi:hypothetical protein